MSLYKFIYISLLKNDAQLNKKKNKLKEEKQNKAPCHSPKKLKEKWKKKKKNQKQHLESKSKKRKKRKKSNVLKPMFNLYMGIFVIQPSDFP